MATQGLSAKDIGDMLGINAQDANVLLKLQGFLEGAPGAYTFTDLGKKFGHSISEDNGYGGFAFRQWTKTYYDESILDVLDKSKETIEGTKQVAKAARDAARASSAKAAEEYWAERALKEAEGALGTELDWKKIALVAGGVLVVTATTVVVVKYSPEIKRGWKAKVSPSLFAIRERLVGKPAEESPES